MDNTSIAKFRFNGFTIRKSTIDIKGESIISPEMSLKIDLNGEHFVKECAFTLYMKVSITNKDKSIKVTSEAVARYEFDKECNNTELDNYFYVNAPAILFPYIRAYIATLSTLSGLTNPIMLPTLNLSKLAGQLKNNTLSK